MPDVNNAVLRAELDNVKKMLVFLFALGKAVDSSINDEDGKITLADAPNFFPVLLTIAAAIEAGGKIPFEIAAATPEEAMELKRWIQEEFDITDDRVEEAIEDGMSIAVDLFRFFAKYVFRPVDSEKVSEATTDEGTTEEASSESEVS